MKVTVDRREENFLVVVLPDGECVSLNCKICPEAKEGDDICIEVFKKETADAFERISGKINRLKNKKTDK